MRLSAELGLEPAGGIAAEQTQNKEIKATNEAMTTENIS